VASECILPWLTERQGCCPLCKTPVLPDEYQRSRRSRSSNSEISNSPRNRIIRSLFRQTTDVGITLADELQHNLEDSSDDFVNNPDPPQSTILSDVAPRGGPSESDV
jgi:hypothetical protein